MPKALTIEEKVLKVTAAKNAAQGKPVETVPQVKPQIRKAPERMERTARGVFNGTRGKLKISEEDVKNFAEAGWTLHIFNDTPGRVEEALSAGWEFVTREEIGGVVQNVVDGNTDLANKIRFRVGQDEAGDALFAYLMKTPTYAYLAEQREIQNRNDRIDSAIRSGKNVRAGDTPDGFYNAGIKLTRE
jgi:hypothetical protein